MKIKTICFSYLCVFIICFTCRAYDTDAVVRYVAQHKELALENEKKYGIPAPITLAQGILESAAGTSGLTHASNNHFGIKAGKSWKGSVHLAWDDEVSKSKFRCYGSAKESYLDHALLLTSNSCYRNLFKINKFDYRGWAHGLKKSGYATAPLYAQALIGIIDQYRLYEVNGGVKLKPGKTVTITRYYEIEKPIFREEYIMEENDESEEQLMIAKAIKNFAVEINEIPCTVIQPGETLSSISRKYDISPVVLLKYNEIASEYQLREGDIVFLAKKKKKFDGSQDMYIVKKGDSLYHISQEFGIQLHQLAKLNGLNDYSRLDEGSCIYLK